jgi:cell division protein ZapE
MAYISPEAQYQQSISSRTHIHDPAQKTAIDAFQDSYEHLIAANNQSPNFVLRAVQKLLFQETDVPTGIYLWGDVGRGKTWLMNLFYDTLPFEEKRRLHFHHFMLDVHKRLGELQNQKNPLHIIAKDYSDKFRVLCLDEFIVTNITDAMLLYGLLEALFSYGITLIATSNRIPDDLYINGLQRERFLPAIKLIKQHTQVLNLSGDTDHRLALLEQTDVYYTPLSQTTQHKLERRMELLATGPIEKDVVLDILNRKVHTIACANEIVWFDFDILCNTPRAAQDYIVLAEDFHTILISNVPIMDEYLDDKARRFIYLIDELYDKSVKLIISAEALPENLYTGKMLRFAFNRTRSRLIEMRSEEYLSKPHSSER